jgi:mRNA-degrading endonuclease toxin of MazEF toxin-antitoxin module
MDNLQTVPKQRLGSLIALLSPGRMIEVDRALAFALVLDVPELWA